MQERIARVSSGRNLEVASYLSCLPTISSKDTTSKPKAPEFREETKGHWGIGPRSGVWVQEYQKS